MKGALGKYCLVGDCAYAAKPYMLVPFKGCKEGLTRCKYYWNFIQSSTRMPVERAFGMLKARFRILLKRCEMNLMHVPNMVVSCLTLHNICIVHGDAFDPLWVQEAEGSIEQELQMCTQHPQQSEVQRTLESTMGELNALRNDSVDSVMERAQADDGCSFPSNLGDGAERRNNLARALYKERSRQNIELVFGACVDEDDGDDDAMYE